MNRISVSSSNILSIGYDSQSQTLEVEFKNGSIYQYFNVPESIYNLLMTAGSHGKYFDSLIRKGGYSHIRVR